MSDARRITGEEMGELTNALCAAFDLHSFEIMLRTRLNRRLDTVAGDGSMRVVAFKTVDVACREGWERKLISAAFAANSGNPELKEFCRTHPHLVDPPPPPAKLPPPPAPPPFTPSLEGDSPIADPEPAVVDPEPDSWFTPRRLIVTAASLLLVGAATWIIIDATRPWGRKQDTDSTNDKRDPPATPSGSPAGPRPKGPIQNDDGEDRQLIINSFRALNVKEASGKDTIRIGLWILSHPYYQDLETIHGLARSLRTGGARVVVAGAVEKRLREVIVKSGFSRVETGDGFLMLEDKSIDAVVLIGVFREAAKPSKEARFSQVYPIVEACAAGKHVFVVLSTVDKAKWPRYLGKSAAVDSAMEAAKKGKTMLYASIPGKDEFKEDFAAFFDAIRSGNPKLRGSVELLP